MKKRIFAIVMAVIMVTTLFIGAIPAMAAEDGITIRIHYHRPDGDYEGWELWAWDLDGNYEVAGTLATDGSATKAPPYKFEAGTPNYVGSHAFGKSIDYLQSIGLESIAKHEHALTEYIEHQLSQISQVHIYAAGRDKAGAVSFNIFRADGTLIHPFDVGVLLDRQGVAVRTGHHCAEPLIDLLQVPGTVRASVALYNTQEDIDAFMVALKKAIMMLD